MKRLKKWTAAATAVMLLQGAALADTIAFEGKVGAAETYEVYAPIGGTVASVTAEIGQSVAAGDVLAQLETEKVYAQESGTVTGVFGTPGDSAATVAQRYGAVMYIEGDSVYTVSASTDKAYDATENKFVHVGEKVVLECYSDGDHTGSGVITAVEGTSYTVEVRSGAFEIGETVNVYRGEIKTEARIGRGTLSRRSPTAVTGSGSIVSIAVEDGDRVEKGDLLFETLSGEFDGLYMSGSAIKAGQEGVVAQINLSQGGRTEKGSVAAVLYPAQSVRIEAQINEADLGEIAVGDKVQIELNWNQDTGRIYEGQIVMISAIGKEQQDSGVTFDVYISFVPDADTRYGMGAIITTVEDEDELA